MSNFPWKEIAGILTPAFVAAFGLIKYWSTKSLEIESKKQENFQKALTLLETTINDHTKKLTDFSSSLEKNVKQIDYLLGVIKNNQQNKAAVIVALKRFVRSTEEKTVSLQSQIVALKNLFIIKTGSKKNGATD